jgi:ABC-2 type transport system ATP-binding protein
LADAMVADPKILILDEPTSGLDPVQIRETLSLIKELGESRTILLSTHILSEIEAICGRLMIIHRGQLASDKKITELELTSAVFVEVQGPAEQVASALRTTDGVESVRLQSQADGAVVCELTTKDDRDLRDAVSQKITRNGWTIRSLDQRRKKVEEHFMEIVSIT